MSDICLRSSLLLLQWPSAWEGHRGANSRNLRNPAATLSQLYTRLPATPISQTYFHTKTHNRINRHNSQEGFKTIDQETSSPNGLTRRFQSSSKIWRRLTGPSGHIGTYRDLGHGEGQVVGQTWTFLHFLRGWTGGLEICDFRVLLVLRVHPHWVHILSWICWICGTEFQRFVVSGSEVEASVAAAESFRSGHWVVGTFGSERQGTWAFRRWWYYGPASFSSWRAFHALQQTKIEHFRAALLGQEDMGRSFCQFRMRSEFQKVQTWSIM